MMSEAATSGVAVKAEPSCQYPIMFYCCETDGRKGAVWQNGIWDGCVYEANVHVNGLWAGPAQFCD